MAQSLFLEKNSPVEFLYVDRQRITSLIGQLSDRGMLIGLKSVAAKSQDTEGAVGGTIGVAKTEAKRSRTFSESAEETYDPFWTHAFTFLQDLEANFAVSLDEARLGSLVKFDAFIQFLDLKIMRNLWEPSAQVYLQSQTQTGPPPLSRKKRRERRQQPSQMSDAVKLGLQVLKEVPHLLHMTFLTRSESKSVFRFWAAMQPDYLTISSEDLVMKYGAVIDGLWTVVGIVDGRIGDSPKPLEVNPVSDGVITAMAGLRDMIGRPRTHWGLTPIAIYAPLLGIAEAEAERADSEPAKQG